MRTDGWPVACGKLFSREGMECIILSYSVCEGTFGTVSVKSSVNGRASYLGSRCHCMCKKCIPQNRSFVLFFWSKTVKEICNSVWRSDWGAELCLLSVETCFQVMSIWESSVTPEIPLFFWLSSAGGVWWLQSQCRSLQLGGSNVHHSLLTVQSFVFWYLTSHKELI